MKFARAVPVLRVDDVDRSVEWYGRVLGFEAKAFPDELPYEFAMLTRDDAEIMLTRANDDEPAGPVHTETWSLYLRLEGEELLTLHQQVAARTRVRVGPWRKFYDDAEFEINDPDGHRICIGEVLPDSVELPTPTE